MLQYASTTAPIHSIKRVGMSKSILQHVGARKQTLNIVIGAYYNMLEHATRTNFKCVISRSE